MRIPFSFTATVLGQTIFGPVTIPGIIGFISIEGALQNPVSGTDFTLSGINITLTEGVPVGTVISGVLDI